MNLPATEEKHGHQLNFLTLADFQIPKLGDRHDKKHEIREDVHAADNYQNLTLVYTVSV